MFQVFAHIMKWMSIPVLLTASMFSYTAARYEPLLVAVVMLGAMALVQQAVHSGQYCWAAGLVAIVVAFSPLFLATKIFLVMGLICMATLAALVAAFHTEPVPVSEA